MDFQHVFICWKVSGRIFEREKKHCMNGLIQPPWGYNQQLIIILLVKTEKVINGIFLAIKDGFLELYIMYKRLFFLLLNCKQT